MNKFDLLKKIAVYGGTTAVAVLMMGQAQASSTFSFSFAGTTGDNVAVSGNGILIGEKNSDGSFTAISGTGSETYGGTSFALTLTQPGIYNSDNLLNYNDVVMLSTGGISFNVVNSTKLGDTLNLWGDFGSSTDYTFEQFDYPDTSTHYSKAEISFDAFEVSAVPEPESYAMLLAGLGLVGCLSRRRKVH